ncbi:MAG: MBL fold metallo-hydrolase [Nitrososphaerales archaeon]
MIVHLADLSFFEPICSLYLIKGEKIALIDAGPSTTASQVLKSLYERSISPKDIEYLIVTHPHLDHAGASSLLLKEMGKAKAIIYYTGLKHFLNPEALINSAKLALGEAYNYMGGMEALNEDRIITVKDEEELSLGSLQLRFLFSPGHAPHHMSIFEENSKVLFPADSYCVYFQESGGLLPQSPPPHFDLERVLSTLRKLKDLNPKVLCLPHFGKVSENIAEFTDKNIQRFEEWREILKGLINQDFDYIKNYLLGKYDKELGIIKRAKLRYLLFDMHVKGFLNYLTI